MDHGDDQRNTSLLSHSYMHGIKRITGNRRTYEEEFKITDEVIETRKKTWSWLFEKFSEISDDVELNIQTLKPASESSSSRSSEVRIPVRKSQAQVQYWIDTGNPPCQAMEAAASDSDETVSISESEATDADEGQYSPCTSMFVNPKLTKSSEHLDATGSSPSSVDTATYIRKNANSGTKNDGDNRNPDNNKVGRSINAATPRASLGRSIQSPGNTDVWDRISSALRKSFSADVGEKDGRRGSGDEAESLLLDENVRRKIDEGLEKLSRNGENKDAEVTVESKDSGISSSAVECIDKGEGTGAKGTSDCSENILPVPNQSVLSRRRKLYTNDDSIFDITSPMVESVRRMTAARKSFHPALDSPSTITRKKTASRPRLLTMRGRKSMNHSINKRNRARSLISKPKVLKSLRISQGGKARAADSVEGSISLGGKVSNASVTVGADDAERSKEVEESLPKIVAISISKSSSSLSSNDVSQIINEEMEKNLKTPAAAVCKKNQPRHSPTLNARRSGNEDCGDDQGSIFQTSAGSSDISKESRMRSMRLVVKNLCATDLRSLGDTDSLSTPSPDASGKKNEGSLSDASTILLPRSGRLAGSSVLSPKVVLHDFLDLRNCCGESEKLNNENWLRKMKKIENTKTDAAGVGKEVNAGEKKSENLQAKITTKEELPERKKLRSKNKVTASKRRAKILSKSFAVSTDSSHSSERTGRTRSATRKLNGDCMPSNHSRETETDAKLPGEEKPTIRFTNTNENQWDSILVLESSDGEDYLTKLSNTFKSRSFGNKSGKNDGGIRTVDDSRASESAKTRQDCYKIVYSTSGEEEAAVETRPRIATRKYSKRNKPKNSTESAGPREDESGLRSEGNEKSGEQSAGVNKRRSGRNKAKQSDHPAARSGANGRAKSVRKSRGEDAPGDGDRSDTVVSGKRKAGDRLAERRINDKENEPNGAPGNCTAPVDRGRDKFARSPRSERREIFRKIASAATDSEDEPEADRVRNWKEGNEGSRRAEGGLNDAFSALLFLPDDDESDNDVAMIFHSNKNADDCRGENKNKDGDNESRGIGSRKGSASPKKRRNKDRAGAPSSSKRRTTNRRCTGSTIVFRTKEYWELDSENS